MVIFATVFIYILMSTFKEIAYICSDLLKVSSDDAFYTTDHIIYLLKKCRALFLTQKYTTITNIAEGNSQIICIDLIKVPTISGENCEGGFLLKSKEKIPNLLNIGIPEIYPVDYYAGNITLVSRERMKYVGHNRWLQNIIYGSISPDDYLYLKSSNPQFLNLEKVKISGIFENIEEAAELSCEDEKQVCDVLDMKFPIEEDLVPQLIETVVKYLSSGLYKPEDTTNNADDDTASMMTFIRNNMKSALQKQIES